MGSDSSALTRAHHCLGATIDYARFHGDAVVLSHVPLADVDINVKAVHVRWIARRRATLEVIPAPSKKSVNRKGDRIKRNL